MTTLAITMLNFNTNDCKDDVGRDHLHSRKLWKIAEQISDTSLKPFININDDDGLELGEK